MLLPFEVMHGLYMQGSLQFQVSMLGKDGHPALAEFWEHALKEEWAKSHPTLCAGHDPANIIPITWHLDGAEVH